MTNLELGVKNFRKRLAFGIRDTVLGQINDPQTFSDVTGVPLDELGKIAELNEVELNTLAIIVAKALDQGIHHFLYGLDNQADGFVVRYQDVMLNEDGMYNLSNDALNGIVQESLFDENGKKKKMSNL